MFWTGFGGLDESHAAANAPPHCVLGLDPALARILLGARQDNGTKKNKAALTVPLFVLNPAREVFGGLGSTHVERRPFGA